MPVWRRPILIAKTIFNNRLKIFRGDDSGRCLVMSFTLNNNAPTNVFSVYFSCFSTSPNGADPGLRLCFIEDIISSSSCTECIDDMNLNTIPVVSKVTLLFYTY